MNNEITVSEEADNLIREYKNDYYSLQIILFFADHPYTQFNELAITHTLDRNGGRGYIQKALSNFVEKRIVKTHKDSSASLYSLTENIQRQVLELAKITPYQRQLLVR